MIGELPKLTGTSSRGRQRVARTRVVARHAGDDRTARRCVVGLASLALILGLRFAAPKVPGALVLVVGGLLASALLDLGGHGVALVGDVPRGLPSPALPAADVFVDHPGTIAIASMALAADRLLADGGRRARVRRPVTATASMSIRSRSPRAWRTPARACSRACPSRPACPPARSTSPPAPGRRWPRS